MEPTLKVPTRLLHATPSAEITPAERSVAWELAAILDEMHQPMQADDVVWLEIPTARLRGPGSRDDNQHLHKVLSKLASIQWRGSDKNGTRYICQLIGQADISPIGDTVKILLPPRAVGFLRTPGNFAELDRAAVYSLAGNARTLYGILKDRFNQPDQLKVPVASWKVDELKGLLGVGDKYDRFANFKAWVLDPAVKAINKTGALDVAWEPVRLGRSVDAVTFTLRLKEPSAAEASAKEARRHSKARGKAQEAVDAPPLVETSTDEQRAAAWWKALPHNQRERLNDELGRLPPGQRPMAAWKASDRSEDPA